MGDNPIRVRFLIAEKDSLQAIRDVCPEAEIVEVLKPIPVIHCFCCSEPVIGDFLSEKIVVKVSNNLSRKILAKINGVRRIKTETNSIRRDCVYHLVC